MGYQSPGQELADYAVELRRLAYTMPAGHEDRLIHLSEQMVRHASQMEGSGRRA